MPWEQAIEPCDPETFAYAFTLASAAGSGSVPTGAVPSSAGESVLLNTGERVHRIVFKDHPMLRALDAVAYAVGGDRERAFPYAMRVFALGHLLGEGVLAQWMRETPEGDTEILEVVLEVAAVAPCQGRFDKDDFTRRVREAVAAEEEREK